MGLARRASGRWLRRWPGCSARSHTELIAETSYPAAKAERLPPTACRYTEVELQLALLRRDMEWVTRLGGSIQQQVIEDWRTKLTALLDLTYDEGERELLAGAYELMPAGVERCRSGNALM